MFDLHHLNPFKQKLSFFFYLLILFNLLPQTQAGFEQMKKDINILQQRYEQMKQNRPTTYPNPLARGITRDDMGLLNQYGCWCYFEEDHGKGKSKPRDEVDKFCKTLHDGYSCLLLDSNEACRPWSIPYSSAIGGGSLKGMSLNEIREECGLKNGGIDTCEARTCMVEGWFVQQFFLFSVFGGRIDIGLNHELGRFDAGASCPIDYDQEPSEKACCSEYPERFPYKTRDGNRGCCGSKTYDVFSLECCQEDFEWRVRLTCD